MKEIHLANKITFSDCFQYSIKSSHGYITTYRNVYILNSQAASLQTQHPFYKNNYSLFMWVDTNNELYNLFASPVYYIQCINFDFYCEYRKNNFNTNALRGNVLLIFSLSQISVVVELV
jgi:hypothetical protein